MAEWPVVLKDELDNVQRGEVAPGDEVAAAWAKISGQEKAAIWIICPRCGTLGHCPNAAVARDGPKWEVADAEGGLTMRPSILCNSTLRLNDKGNVKAGNEPCGGHFWLTNGVLREV